jgi:hypothetical protein
VCYQDLGPSRHLRGTYPVDQPLDHINIRELQAAIQAVQLRLHLCRGQSVLLRTDNICKWAYLNNKGGRVPHLNDIAVPFLLWCRKMDVTLRVSFLAGRQNRIADRLSRQMKVDRTSWMLDPKVFDLLQSHFGPVSVDLFASPSDKQVPRFFS